MHSPLQYAAAHRLLLDPLAPGMTASDNSLGTCVGVDAIEGALNPLSHAACTGVLLVSGAVSSLPSRALPKLGAISLLWNIVLPLTLTLLVPMLAPYHQRPKLVWGTFFGSAYSTSGITSDPYLFLQVSGVHSLRDTAV